MINVLGCENDAANWMDAGIKSQSRGAEKGAKFDLDLKKSFERFKKQKKVTVP